MLELYVPAGGDVAEVADLQIDVHEEVVTTIEAARVRRFVCALPAKDRLVIYWRYGLDCRQLTHAEIGRRLGVTKQAVIFIEKRALERLRCRYAAEGLADAA